MKKQIVIIHGGDSFDSYEDYLNFLKTFPVNKSSFMSKSDWKRNFSKLIGEGYEVLQPRMPNKSNAKYDEWVIWFERMSEFFDKELILIGHSLGATFLVKYLSANTLPSKVRQLHLVAPPHNNTDDIGDFIVPSDVSNVTDQVSDVYFYFSKDDPVVPFSESTIYRKQFPDAEFEIFENNGHFNSEEFPKLIEIIKNFK